MPEDGAKSPNPLPAEQVADEAVFAADQTRKTSAWLASALGAIPSLAIVGALVRAPGDYGFNDDELKLGIGLAAAGALLGTLAFARVMAPLKLTDKNLNGFDINRLPGHNFDSTKQLLDEIALFKSAARQDRLEGAEARRQAESTKVAAAEAEKNAITAKAAADKQPSDQALQTKAAETRRIADTKKSEMDAAVASAAAQAATTPIWDSEIKARERFRGDAIRLTAADKVGHRYLGARVAAIVSVTFVAAGIYYLALAPIEKTPSSAAEARQLQLVSWSPSEAGTAALGCDVTSIRGLQVGGNEKAPQIITFPTEGCPDSKLVAFPAETETPFGPVTKVRSVPASEE